MNVLCGKGPKAQILWQQMSVIPNPLSESTVDLKIWNQPSLLAQAENFNLSNICKAWF